MVLSVRASRRRKDTSGWLRAILCAVLLASALASVANIVVQAAHSAASCGGTERDQSHAWSGVGPQGSFRLSYGEIAGS
eukprot:2951575-Rhodomonas_salina.1